MNSDQKKAFFLSLTVGILMLVCACLCLFYPKPDTSVYKPWIPEGARVLPAENVKTGTFQINISKAEMVRKVNETGEIPLVVIYDKKLPSEGAAIPGVGYWLPGKGGIFEHYMDYVPTGSFLFNWSGIFDSARGVFVVSPSRSWGFFILSLILCFISTLIAWNAFEMEIFKADTD